MVVDGARVNRGAGYGLELPCTYCFYGPKPYADKLQEVVKAAMCVNERGQLESARAVMFL